MTLGGEQQDLRKINGVGTEDVCPLPPVPLRTAQTAHHPRSSAGGCGCKVRPPARGAAGGRAGRATHLGAGRSRWTPDALLQGGGFTTSPGRFPRSKFKGKQAMKIKLHVRTCK